MTLKKTISISSDSPFIVCTDIEKLIPGTTNLFVIAYFEHKSFFKVMYIDIKSTIEQLPWADFLDNRVIKVDIIGNTQDLVGPIVLSIKAVDSNLDIYHTWQSGQGKWSANINLNGETEFKFKEGKTVIVTDTLNFKK